MRAGHRAWIDVRKYLGGRPLVAAELDGDVPVFAERYFLHRKQASVPALRSHLLVVHLGGAQVTGGQRGAPPVEYVPSLSMLIPAGTSTTWSFGGAIDIAVFYFFDADALARHASARSLSAVDRPMHFSDQLTSAVARQIVDELARGRKSDRAFPMRLASVLVEQLARVAAGAAGRQIGASFGRLNRLSAVLAWIRGHLADDLSTPVLAARVGVSASHFHHLFADSMGTTPQRHVRQVRLEHAASLLTRTDMPIATVADRCGFDSQSHFTTSFHRAFGISPGRYRRLATTANPKQ